MRKVAFNLKHSMTSLIVRLVRTHKVLRSPYEHTTKNYDEGVTVIYTDYFNYINLTFKQVLVSGFIYAKDYWTLN